MNDYLPAIFLALGYGMGYFAGYWKRDGIAKDAAKVRATWPSPTFYDAPGEPPRCHYRDKPIPMPPVLKKALQRHSKANKRVSKA